MADSTPQSATARTYIAKIRQPGSLQVEQIRASSSSAAFENAFNMIDISRPFSIYIRNAS